MITGDFRLDVEEEILYYKKQEFIKGRDKIVSFWSQLAISTPEKLESLDISDEEQTNLENMLTEEILNNGHLINS